METRKEVIVVPVGPAMEQLKFGVEAQRLFGTAWKPGLQISMPRSIDMDDLGTDPETARSLVDSCVGAALEEWPYRMTPAYAYVDVEPEDGWLWKGTLQGLFTKFDARLMDWMVDAAKKRLPDTRMSVYRMPHVPRKQVPTRTMRTNMVKAGDMMMRRCDYGTTNLYLNHEVVPVRDGDHWDMHSERIDVALDVGDEVFGERPNIPMLWTGWINRGQLDYFELVFEKIAQRQHINSVMVWADVGGEVGEDGLGLKTRVQIQRLQEVAAPIQRWLEV